MEKVQHQHSALALRLQQSETHLNQLKESNHQLTEEIARLGAKVEEKEAELAREKEKRCELERSMNSNKKDSQLEHLLMAKQELEGEVEQLKKKADEQGRKTAGDQSRLKKLAEAN